MYSIDYKYYFKVFHYITLFVFCIMDEIEKTSIEQLSFVPENIEDLCAQAVVADQMIQTNRRGPMLSKLFKIKNLCPESLNPDDTILNKLARGDIGPGTTIIDDYFAVINDRNMPLGGTSCGPNGVLYRCNSDFFGERRINLFGKNVETTLQMARSYIAFRNAHLPQIFNLYVEKMKSFLTHWKIDPGGDDDSPKLPENMRKHYRTACGLLCSVNSALKSQESPASLKSLGISVVSFCQTWQKDGDITPAQFSVMSPHFQTRFYISDASKLPLITRAQINSYCKLIEHFTGIMLEAGYAKSFVNIDGLVSNHAAKQIDQESSAFLTGIPAGGVLSGIGKYTTGLVVQIQTEHAPKSTLLTGRYRLIGDYASACNLILHHIPSNATIKANMIHKLCNAKSRKISNISTAVLETIGGTNQKKLNKHLFSTLQWKLI